MIPPTSPAISRRWHAEVIVLLRRLVALWWNVKVKTRSCFPPSRMPGQQGDMIDGFCGYSWLLQYAAPASSVGDGGSGGIGRPFPRYRPFVLWLCFRCRTSAEILLRNTWLTA